LETVTTKKYSLQAKQAKQAMTKMLDTIGDHLPREAGNGWKLPTFHNTMHMVDDMCKNGKPKEANTEVGEKKKILCQTHWSSFVNLRCCCCYLFKRKLHVN
jgi:hypothetical protein